LGGSGLVFGSGDVRRLASVSHWKTENRLRKDDVLLCCWVYGWCLSPSQALSHLTRIRRNWWKGLYPRISSQWNWRWSNDYMDMISPQQEN
jgi:hypothetical protein